MTPAPADHPAVPLARKAVAGYSSGSGVLAFIRALTPNDTLYYSVSGGGTPQGYDFPLYEVRLRWYAGDEVFTVRLMVDSQRHDHLEITKEAFQWRIPCHLQAYEKPQTPDLRDAIAKRTKEIEGMRRAIECMEAENKRDIALLEQQ